jgi:flagellar biosynthesis protein FliR
MAPRNSTTPSPTQPDRQLQRTLLAIRLGATIFGVLAGVVCYLALDQFTAIGLVPAFVIGLIFALLTRTASASLARDWLVRNASRANNGRRDPSPPSAG